MSKRNSHGECIKSSPDQTNNYRNSDELKTKANKEQEEKLKDAYKPLAKKPRGTLLVFIIMLFLNFI